jgi:ribosomal protein S18 acetylase RimI-like enzyme
VPLRALRQSDLQAIEEWLPEVVATSGYYQSHGEMLRDVMNSSTSLLYEDQAGSAFLSFHEHAPTPQAASIDFIAVRPDQRRRGIAGRAALELEQRMASSHRHCYVVVPSAAGLALYFWLRLGYRPLLKGSWPRRPSETAVWMIRGLTHAS